MRREHNDSENSNLIILSASLLQHAVRVYIITSVSTPRAYHPENILFTFGIHFIRVVLDRRARKHTHIHRRQITKAMANFVRMSSIADMLLIPCQFPGLLLSCQFR